MEEYVFRREVQEARKEVSPFFYSIAGRVEGLDETLQIGAIWRRSGETGIGADILVASTVITNNTLVRYEDQLAYQTYLANSRFFASVPVDRTWESLAVSPSLLRSFTYMKDDKIMHINPPRRTRAAAILETLERDKARLRLEAGTVITLGGVLLDQVVKF